MAMRLSAFWAFARRMLRHRRLVAGTLFFSVISAGGLAAGLVSLGPILKLVLEHGRDGSANPQSLAAEWVERHGASLGFLHDAAASLVAYLPTKAFDGVALIMAGIAALTIVGAAANFMHQWCSLTLVTRVTAAIRLECFRHVLHLPLSTVVRRGPAELVSRVNKDSVELQRGFLALTSKALAQVTKGLAGFAAAVWFDWRLTLVAVVVAPVVAVVLRKFGKRIRRGTRGALRAQEDLLRTSNESMQGLRAVKTATAEREALSRFGRANRVTVREELVVRTARAASGPIVESIAVFVVIGLALIAAKQILAGTMPLDRFILALAGLAVAGGSFKPVTALLNDIQASEAPAQRLQELLVLPTEGKRERSLPAFPRHGSSLRFDDVSFRYGDESPWTLREVSLEIHHGEIVAFVGPNGCGKTTLVSLLPRLMDPSEGRVLLDGVDLLAGNLRSLREQIGVVTQEAVLIADTVAANIRFGLTGVSFDAIERAARRARAHDFIMKLPDGYATKVSEQGASLSGGQRQRIAIARAILREPALLIMDEATSQIDAESEDEINRAVKEFAVGRTVLIVAHRLSSVIGADRIVVMDGGRIVDVGRHDALADRCDVYRRLVRTQLVGGR
ncbi:MAG: ABC transporter ATP-binding protein [Phycisphaerae bacterium]|nr:ABC transporter ATP-binding protein [Phycisphaerae bacterium]